MQKRFVSIWFRRLKTDWFTLRKPELKGVPFVMSAPDHGRMIVAALNYEAQLQDIFAGMTLADARALVPALHVEDDIPGLSIKLLERIARWCIRFTPAIAVDLPDGIVLDASGCTHLWNGEQMYLETIFKRLQKTGYDVRISISGSIGTSWALSRYGKNRTVVPIGGEASALLCLPPEALRLDPQTTDRLHKLGLTRIGEFASMPRRSLERRFGKDIIRRINQALGHEEENVELIQPVQQYLERLPSFEPIVNATGISIALERLLEALCARLKAEEKGLRVSYFRGYRLDGKVECISISTGRPSNNPVHLYKLFEIRLSTIEPDLGIELFELEAQKVEDVSSSQQKLWECSAGLENAALSELIDRIAGKVGEKYIHRYLPAEHYWPERSIEPASSLQQKTAAAWQVNRLRPLQLLATPERIVVTAPIPDYPPMLFRHQGKLHKIVKADGPERIEQEWWLQQGVHRDYYCIEDEAGFRYWIFRSGHYDPGKNDQWFLHGFFP